MKKTSLLLLIVLLFNLVGCASSISNLPEGFKNKDLYNDLVYILQTVESDIKNNTLTHSLNPAEYKKDKFLLNFEKYASKKLTDTEKRAETLGWDILEHFYFYSTEHKIREKELINSIEELINLLQLNINIKDRL